MQTDLSQSCAGQGCVSLGVKGVNCRGVLERVPAGLFYQIGTKLELDRGLFHSEGRAGTADDVLERVPRRRFNQIAIKAPLGMCFCTGREGLELQVYLGESAKKVI